MADVIYVGAGGAQAQQSGGFWSFVKDLLPVGAILVAAYLVYSYFAGSGSQAGDTTSTGSGSSGSTLVDILNPKTATDGTKTTKSGTVGDSTLSQLITPKPASGGGYQAINVQGGEATPVTYWPGGEGVVSFGDNESPFMVAETDYVIEHGIASQGITGAWWDPGPVATYANEDLAVISGQSNVPAGVKHCNCNAALVASGKCGPADSWYYC